MAVYAAQSLVLALAARLAQPGLGEGSALPRRTSSQGWSRKLPARDGASFLGACLPAGLALPDTLSSVSSERAQRPWLAMADLALHRGYLPAQASELIAG